MSTINKVGNLGLYANESAGSIAQNPKVKYEKPPVTEPQGDTVSFRGKAEGKKKGGFFKKLLGLAAIAGVVIGGAGYAHKANLVGKLGEGKIKNLLSKTEPFTKKCYEWCKTLKTKGVEIIEAIKGKFSKAEVPNG